MPYDNASIVLGFLGGMLLVAVVATAVICLVAARYERICGRLEQELAESVRREDALHRRITQYEAVIGQ